MQPKTREQYIRDITNPWKYWPMLLLKLPSIAFWGARVISIDENECSVKIPFRYTTKNPFRSIYFAALNGTAEISTGYLLQMKLIDQGEFSMLVTHFEAQFFKKSDTDITFTCSEGKDIDTVLKSISERGDSSLLVLTSSGINTSGIEVCRMKVTWSIKKK